MQYVLLAVAPGIAICLFIFYRDVYNREPGLNLLISFGLGVLAILPAIWFEKAFLPQTVDGSMGGLIIFSYAVVGLCEEGGKFLGLRVYSYNQKGFDEPLDGIVYAVIISMGFATAENIKYVLNAEAGKAVEVGLGRMFTAVPAHASFAVVMGYFVGKAKFEADNNKKVLLSFAGLFGAIFFHGTYDVFLLMPTYSYWGLANKEYHFLTWGGILALVICLVLCRKLIIRDSKISKQMFKPKAPPPPPPPPPKNSV
jgi:RsiW-degrading membrane proteinase PrsW (M82 family)